MSIIPIIIAARQNQYIRTFRQTGAFSSVTSIRLKDYRLRKSVIFDKLVRQGVIAQAGEDRYYLDQQREEEVRKKRIPLLIVALIVVLIVLLSVWTTNR